jgi:putative acetyltransferase
MEICFRPYRIEDCSQITNLFYQTVHTVNIADYSDAEVVAWAPAIPNPSVWDASFQSHYTLVAHVGSDIVGFGDITRDGYLDRLYVHHAFQRQKIATRIVEGLEIYARKNSLPIITTQSSITATPFFVKRGYQIITKQKVSRCGVLLTNFVMKKVLFR